MARLTKRLPAGGIQLNPECNPTFFAGFPQNVYQSNPFWNVFNRLCEYEEIGTVEEFKDLKEKAEQKWEEDYCDWKPFIDHARGYWKNCRWENDDIDAFSVKHFEFCPYCGKKIKVVRDETGI